MSSGRGRRCVGRRWREGRTHIHSSFTVITNRCTDPQPLQALDQRLSCVSGTWQVLIQCTISFNVQGKPRFFFWAPPPLSPP